MHAERELPDQKCDTNYFMEINYALPWQTYLININRFNLVTWKTLPLPLIRCVITHASPVLKNKHRKHSDVAKPVFFSLTNTTAYIEDILSTSRVSNIELDRYLHCKFVLQFCWYVMNTIFFKYWLFERLLNIVHMQFYYVKVTVLIMLVQIYPSFNTFMNGSNFARSAWSYVP